MESPCRYVIPADLLWNLKRSEDGSSRFVIFYLGEIKRSWYVRHIDTRVKWQSNADHSPVISYHGKSFKSTRTSPMFSKSRLVICPVQS
jgi:hypothetical protein